MILTALAENFSVPICHWLKVRRLDFVNVVASVIAGQSYCGPAWMKPWHQYLSSTLLFKLWSIFFDHYMLWWYTDITTSIQNKSVENFLLHPGYRRFQIGQAVWRKKDDVSNSDSGPKKNIMFFFFVTQKGVSFAGTIWYSPESWRLTLNSEGCVRNCFRWTLKSRNRCVRWLRNVRKLPESFPGNL